MPEKPSGSHLTGSRIVYWSGHGAGVGGDLKLLTTDSGESAAEGTGPADAAGNAAATGECGIVT